MESSFRCGVGVGREEAALSSGNSVSQPRESSRHDPPLDTVLCEQAKSSSEEHAGSMAAAAPPSEGPAA